MSAQDHLNPQQFYHGSKWDLKPGDMLTPEEADKHRNYSPGAYRTTGRADDRPGLYFSSNPGAARWYVDGADASGKSSKVYEVQPTGDHMHDYSQRRDPDARVTHSPLRVLGVNKRWSGDLLPASDPDRPEHERYLEW